MNKETYGLNSVISRQRRCWFFLKCLFVFYFQKTNHNLEVLHLLPISFEMGIMEFQIFVFVIKDLQRILFFFFSFRTFLILRISHRMTLQPAAVATARQIIIAVSSPSAPLHFSHAPVTTDSFSANTSKNCHH